MNISLLCPTRHRPHYLIPLLESIFDTVHFEQNVEILFAIDDDDSSTLHKFISLKKWEGRIHGHIRKKSDYLNRDYYNWLSRKASGKYLWAIGDDVRFKTSDWDTLLIQTIEDYLKTRSDRIAYITTEEDGSQATHTCFPMITKEAFKAMGFFLHPELLTWGADRTIYELYSAVNRVINVPSVHIEHVTYHDGKAPCDETAKSVKERFFRDPDCHNKVSSLVIPKQILLLRKAINEQSSK